ncbi:NAD(P)/FAD-dependent oxidoreductase [Salipaludibacillus aurantiacus]|uniref:Pyridine nucleotide-disulphide oxidoreductase n=1 Tax=Salipaludibacillus aurantiacus TaxID=1601833 RepID=A0A1H9TXH4_9BACI|nr:NAD(P)/FAD-dependent oxidoreductase [Salipaludibacillus aurantiacus]SES01463.1 Pyridine nucleotide-disulphide oxidoreductase [Salipaludibacillus aurantiacus]
MEKHIDTAIIGGGISGLSAAIYTSQAGLTTTVFDTGKSQLKPISKVYNYPGFPEGISGKELISKMTDQSKQFGTEIVAHQVEKLERLTHSSEGSRFKLTFSSEEGGQQTLSAKYVIVASNIHLQPLKDLGIETEVSPAVPSGKISRVRGGSWNGETHIPGLYVAGLLSGIPTQSIIAAGQGTQAAMEIISAEKGKAHVWHDK